MELEGVKQKKRVESENLATSHLLFNFGTMEMFYIYKKVEIKKTEIKS